jgi:hypothetical protein
MSNNNEGKKLWINIPASNYSGKRQIIGSAVSSFSNPNRIAPVKPTVTTLLRHHSVLLRQERSERSQVQNYAAGSLQSHQDKLGWRSRELEEQKQIQKEETKRILKARLAYHKAIAATEHKANEKLAQAQYMRQQVTKLINCFFKEFCLLIF